MRNRCPRASSSPSRSRCTSRATPTVPGSRIRVTIAAPNGTQPVWSFGQTEPEGGTATESIGFSPSHAVESHAADRPGGQRADRASRVPEPAQRALPGLRAVHERRILNAAQTVTVREGEVSPRSDWHRAVRASAPTARQLPTQSPQPRGCRLRETRTARTRDHRPSSGLHPNPQPGPRAGCRSSRGCRRSSYSLSRSSRASRFLH